MTIRLISSSHGSSFAGALALLGYPPSLSPTNGTLHSNLLVHCPPSLAFELHTSPSSSNLSCYTPASIPIVVDFSTIDVPFSLIKQRYQSSIHSFIHLYHRSHCFACSYLSPLASYFFSPLLLAPSSPLAP